MNRFIIFTFVLCSSILSIQSIDRTEFKNLGTHFERNSYEKNATFEDFAIEDLLTRNLTRDDYRILTKSGLRQYFKLLDAIKENKKIAGGNYIIEDGFNFTKTPGNENLVFDGVRGFADVKIENPQFNSVLDSKFQVRSVIHFPQLTFFGRLKDKPFQYKWFEVSYVSTEYKKVDDEFQIEPVQNSEEMHFNRVDISIGDEKISNRTVEREIQQKLSDYLYDVINFLRASTNNYWVGTDNWYLRQRKDQMLDRLFKIVLKTVETYKAIGCELPRFTFRDQKTSTNFEMINGNLEINPASVRSLMKNINDLGDIEMAFPLSGSVRYYVSEQNCTGFCQFFGHRFTVTKADVRVTFLKSQIKNVQWFFEMKYAETLEDNRPGPRNDNVVDAVLQNVSKVVNERFLIFLKSFLGAEFF